MSNIRGKPKVVSIAVAASASQTIFDAGANDIVYVMGYVLCNGTAANTAQWKSATTAISGVMDMAAQDSIVAPLQMDAPYLKTTAGQDLVLTSGAGTNGLNGHVTIIVDCTDYA